MTGQPLVRTDVAVVGAGPAGSVIASHLARDGYSVELIEATRFERPRVGESIRSEVRALLSGLDLWDDVIATGPVPSSGTRSQWGQSELDVDSLLFDPFGHGWLVDRRAFDQALADGAARFGVRFRTGTRVVSTTWEPIRGWRLEVDNGPAVTARFLVDASGRSGRMARHLRAERLIFDRLVGIAGVWSEPHGEPAGNHVLVEACAAGWWYSAPLPGGDLIAVLMTDADLCRHQRLTDPDRWRDALADTVHTVARVPAGVPSQPVRSTAAFSSRTRRPDDARPWLAIGDASLALDPLTGDGVGRAMKDAVETATIVEELLEGPIDDPVTRASIIGEREDRRDRDCDRYLRERLQVYESGPPLQTPFWVRRHGVAADYRRTAAASAPADAALLPVS